MSKLSAFCMIICTAGLGFVSCNSKSEELDYTLPSSALVKSFSLSANDSVLDNLDKVFFSIDLTNGNIFNADSMPYGTKINKLIPVITTGGASAVELVVPRPGQSDTTYNYVTNPNDTIDFSNGIVKLKIQSIDELVTMEYNIKVNVHQVKSDSLSWGDMAYTELPTNLSRVDAQHSLKFKGNIYCLTTDGDSYCLSVTDNPATKTWSDMTVDFGFKADVESFRASSSALFILDEIGALYKSDDEGVTWTSTGKTFTCLIGGYGEEVLGTVKTGDVWTIDCSDGRSVAAPADFPVTGTSVPVDYSFPMSALHQLTIVGGRLADGSLTDKAWGYDGNNWACLSTVALPEPLEGVTVTPYYAFEENEYWVATKESLFLLIGGRNNNGQCNTKTYISYNYGVSWKEASEEMQLPANVPALYGAQTVVVSSLLGSRASTAITSWECPYIYMFGGYNSSNKLNNSVWRGIINRLSFKPLQ
ncbi:MAG: hypothetical protein K2M54_01665 [Muribaculaceae bacterium]|nr:hypothetical protein [Muribaculaceae bacterium]